MEQHKVQGVICRIQVIEPLQMAVAILNLDVPLAGSISLTITCMHMHPHSQGDVRWCLDTGGYRVQTHT
jgi:hypothetical protein